jgi:hypothetical protein
VRDELSANLWDLWRLILNLKSENPPSGFERAAGEGMGNGWGRVPAPALALSKQPSGCRGWLCWSVRGKYPRHALCAMRSIHLCFKPHPPIHPHPVLSPRAELAAGCPELGELPRCAYICAIPDESERV